MKYLLPLLLVGCRTYPIPGDDPVVCIMIGSRCYDVVEIALNVCGLIIFGAIIYIMGKPKPR